MPYEVYQKNEKNIPITIEDNDGALDISGTSIIFVVKNNEEVVIKKTIDDGITIINAENGEIEIDITDEDNDIIPMGYDCELLLIDAEGNRYTALQGKYVIEKSYTKDEVV